MRAVQLAPQLREAIPVKLPKNLKKKEGVADRLAEIYFIWREVSHCSQVTNLLPHVRTKLGSALEGFTDRDAMFKVGIVSGPFTSMGPHQITGMADYFGPIVNRTAQVAMNCEPGKVCVGIPLSNGVRADPPDFGPTVSVKLQGIKKLKGITVDMAIFECSKRNIDTPYR